MAACEECWTEASWVAAVKGGVASDYYAGVLAKNEGHHNQTIEGASDD